MEVARIRSCYSTLARFWKGGPLLPITWFWSPTSAHVFPLRHRFASSVWDDEKPFDPDVGEQGSARRVYSKGALPGALVGDHFCGSMPDFEGNGGPGVASFTGGVRTCCVSVLPNTCVGGGPPWQAARLQVNGVDYPFGFGPPGRFPWNLSGQTWVQFLGNRSGALDYVDWNCTGFGGSMQLNYVTATGNHFLPWVSFEDVGPVRRWTYVDNYGLYFGLGSTVTVSYPF